jgi:hypothetical protein
MAVFWVIALMMEAASTSETSVNSYQTTWRNNPEDSHLHTRRRENLKFHVIYYQLFFVMALFFFTLRVACVDGFISRPFSSYRCKYVNKEADTVDWKTTSRYGPFRSPCLEFDIEFIVATLRACGVPSVAAVILNCQCSGPCRGGGGTPPPRDYVCFCCLFCFFFY